LYFKVLFMNEQNQPGIETIQDIKRMMERSSRFISLSGLSGIAAGTCALIGAYIARQWFIDYYGIYKIVGYTPTDFQEIKWKLLVLAAAVLAAALVLSFYFTWRRTKANNTSLWNHTSKRLAINMLIPLAAGGLFVLGMLRYDEWKFVAPACLIFYGIALVNASKYTLSEVRYVGLLEIALGLLNMFFIGYGLNFWALGFGVVHIFYGFIMWWKYERKTPVTGK
jgi:hypothetical protein